MAIPNTPSGSWMENTTDLGMLNQGDTSSTNLMKYVEDPHAKAFQNSSQNQSDLITQLTNTNKFTLPAGGTYFYLNPVLNHDGALLCNIYNDNEESAANLNPSAPARKIVNVTPAPPRMVGPSSLSINGESKAKAAILRQEEDQDRLAGERAKREARRLFLFAPLYGLRFAQVIIGCFLMQTAVSSSILYTPFFLRRLH